MLSLADLFLDTRNYGSHTVCSDAMYNGLPVLTLPSLSFSSRVASSLNHVVGLGNELVVANRKEFTDVAFLLAKNNNVLYKIHQQLQFQRGKSIFNSKNFSGKLEVLYSALIEQREENYNLLFDCSDKYCGNHYI